MINIEVEEADQERFEFNKPFSCIRMEYGQSSEMLSTLGWRGELTVIWLDYDRRLNRDMLEDVEYLASNLEPWSLLIVTVRAKAADYGEEKQKVKVLEQDLGSSITLTISQSDLAQSRIAATLLSICNQSISDILSQRNGIRNDDEHLVYKQLLNFVYDDGTPMMTFGGLLVPKIDEDMFSNCAFESLDFYRPGLDQYEIRAPLLTFKEQRELDSRLPDGSLSITWLDKDDIDAYARVYRHFPSFTEVEL